MAWPLRAVAQAPFLVRGLSEKCETLCFYPVRFGPVQSGRNCSRLSGFPGWSVRQAAGRNISLTGDRASRWLALVRILASVEADDGGIQPSLRVRLLKRAGLLLILDLRLLR